MEVRRIAAEDGFIREIKNLRKRVQAQETRASGNIVIRETLKTTDPETGVATIVGQLPDGSYGIQPYVYDITPPPVASTPTVSAVPGVISVTWDGQFVNGELAPKDFTRLNIIGHKMDGTATVESFVIGEILNSSNIVYFSSDVIPVGDTWTFSFEAEDYNTNRAEWSTRSAPVTMESVVTDAGVNEALEGIKTDVATAQTAASTAQGAADTAQQAADDAAQSAQEASNLAAGKTKTHYQTASPGLTGNSVGDMWVDIDDSYKLYTWSGSAWVLTQDSDAAADLAATKIRSFVQGTAPTATSVGDIWMNTSNKNELSRWSGSAWVSYRDLSIADADAKAATAIANAATAKDIADGKVATYFQPGQPTGQVAGDVGDLWFDTDDGNKMYRWTGSAWVVADDQRIASAVTAAANAKTIADSKITTFYQPGQPSSTGRTAGDLWVDTDDQNKLYRWNGASWDSARDLSIASAASSASAALTAAQNAQNAADAAKAVADGAIRTWYQATAPTGLNNTTDIGDLWFDTDDGQAYRWNGTAFVIIEDNSIAVALNAAQNAQTTADGKITSYYQPGQPATGEIGDLWFDTDDKNKPYYCSNSAPVTWTPVRDGAIGDAQSTANTALTTANGKNVTYYQTAMPTGGTYVLGDTWIDTDDGNKMYVYNGTTFVNAQDGAIGAANTLAASKGKTIIQSAAPSVADQLVQNLWIDTTNGANTPKRWSGSAWVAITDKAATDAAAAAVAAQSKADTAFNNAASAATAAGNAQTTADGKNRVWYQTTAPAGTAHKDGDLWFDTDDGNKLYLWKAGTTLAWTVFQDTAISVAQQAANNAATAASNAQTTANNAQTAAATADSKAVTAKNTADTAVTNAQTAQTDATKALQDALAANTLAASKGKVLYQTTAPTGTDANAQTLWIDTTGGANTPKRWTSGTTWVTVTDKVATDAAALAGTKGKILFQTTAPTGADASALTLWIDTTNGANTPKKWVSGTTWAAITDKAALDAAQAAANAATAASNAQTTANTAVTNAQTAQTLAQQAFDNAASAATAAGNAQTTADGKNRVWYQDDAPTGTAHKINDIWFDTNDGNKPYRWTGSAWLVAQDAAIAAAQAKADAAFSTSNGKNTTYYQTAQPSGGTYILGDLWFDTDDNYKLYTYTGSIWQNTQDAAGAKAQAIAAAASDATTKANNAQTAAISAAASDATTKANNAQTAAIAAAATDATNKVATKNASYYQTAQPTGGTYKQGDLWFDTDDNYKLYTYTGSIWQVTQDASGAQAAAISAAATDAANKAATAKAEAIAAAATDASTKATNAQTAAISAAATDASTKMATAQRIAIDSVAYSKNPSFEDWTASIPTGYGTWNTPPIKETSIIRTGNFAMRFTCTDTATMRGVTLGNTLAHSPNIEYFTVEMDVQLISGTTFGGAGLLLDWGGLTPNRVTVSLEAELPAPTIGKWYRVSKVIRRPTSTGTFTSMSGYLMGQYNSGLGTVAVKDMVYDWLNIRPSTTEEITAYGTPASITTLTNTVNTKTRTYYQGISPGLTGNTTGDIWFDTANGNKAYVWNGAWTSAQDASIATAQTTATNAQTSANGKNKVIYSTSAASGTTGYTAGDTWFQRDVSNNVIAMWEFTTSWQARALAHQVVASIDAAKISVGTLDVANRIGANAITATKLAVGDFTNLFTSPQFLPATGGVTLSGGATVYSGAEVPPIGLAANIGSRDHVSYDKVAARPGEQFYVEFTAKRISGTAALNAGIWVTNAAGAASTGWSQWSGLNGSMVQIADLGNGWARYSAKPFIDATWAGVSWAQLYFQIGQNSPFGTNWLISDIVWRRRATGELLVDGTIKAGSAIIENGAISNAQIANLDAAKITAGTIAAARLDAETVKSKLIEASYIDATDIFAQNSITSTSGIFGTMDASVINAGTIAAARLDAEVVKSKLIEASYLVATDIFAPNSITSASGIFGTMDASVINAGTIAAARLDAETVKAKLIEASYILASDIFAQNSVTSASGIFGTMDASVLNAGTIAAARLDANVIQAKLLSAGKINADDILVAGSITSSSAVIASLDASKITVGTLAAARIGAKSIGVDKLLVQGSDNLIVEGDFSGAGASWDLPAGIVINATAGRNSLPAMVITNSAALQTSFNVAGSPKVAIESVSDAPNAYRVSMWVKSTVTVPTNGILLNARFRSTTGTYTTQSVTYTTGTPPVAATIATNTWVELTGVVTAPANTISVAFSVSTAAAFSTGVVTIDQVTAVRAATGELIVDGAVTATKIATGTITATNGIIASLDVSKVTAGTMSGAFIASKSILADRLVISSTDNLVVEADFGNNGTSWEVAPTKPQITVNATAGRGSMPAMRVTGTTVVQTSKNLVNRVAVGSEDRFRASMWVKSTAALAANKVTLSLRCYTTATAYTDIVAAGNKVLVANQYTLVEGYSPALPANTIAIEFFITVANDATGTITDIDYVAVTRAADGKLVVDGAIDGKTITGALLQTNVEATKGIKIDATGMRAFNSTTGDRTVFIDPLTGKFTSSGSFSTETTEVVSVPGYSGSMFVSATFGALYKPNGTDYSYQPGILFERTLSVGGSKTPASISYNGAAILVNTYPDNSGNTFVPNSGGAYISVGESGISMDAYRSGATDTPYTKYPALYINGGQDAHPNLRAVASYNPEDGESRETGLELSDYSFSNGIYSTGTQGMFTHLFHKNNSGTGATKQSESRIILGDGGNWVVFGKRDSDGAVVSKIESRAWDVEGSLGLWGANSILFSTTPTSHTGDVAKFDSTKATFYKPVDAPSYKVNGVDLSTGVLQVFATSGTLGNQVAPPARLTGWTVKSEASTDNSLFTFSGTKFTARDTGVYDIFYNVSIAGPATGRSFIEIGNYSSVDTYGGARGDFGAGEDTVSVSLTLKLNAGDTFDAGAFLTIGSGTINYIGTIRIKKVAAPVPLAGSNTQWQSGDVSLSGDLTVAGNTSIKHRRAEFNNGGFYVVGATVWDIGPQALNTSAPATLNNDFCQPGPYSGSIQFNKSGYYMMTAFVSPQDADPAGAWLRANRGSDGRNLGQATNGAAWETVLTLIPFYFAAGDYVRFAYSAGATHNISSWVTIVQAY